MAVFDMRLHVGRNPGMPGDCRPTPHGSNRWTERRSMRQHSVPCCRMRNRISNRPSRIGARCGQRRVATRQNTYPSVWVNTMTSPPTNIRSLSADSLRRGACDITLGGVPTPRASGVRLMFGLHLDLTPLGKLPCAPFHVFGMRAMCGFRDSKLLVHARPRSHRRLQQNPYHWTGCFALSVARSSDCLHEVSADSRRACQEYDRHATSPQGAPGAPVPPSKTLFFIVAVMPLV